MIFTSTKISFCAFKYYLFIVVMKPLWEKAIYFIEEKLGITVWDGLRDVTILIIGNQYRF